MITASGNESDLAVVTPRTLVQCNNTLLKWSGGFGAYSIVPGSDPDGPILEDLGEQDDTNVTWRVNLSAGTSVVLAIRDSEAVSIQSDAVQIRNSTDSSCLNE
ncbi:uncharacterized protein BT62DRAFT_935851 [Guyanagaster necrorhizus]|uniref:Uncharacterized protein n=1 Tax=Guyanagaster necrorhizus TaxID=856835 RepID=A0A9P7VL54_9AGAR|nr:uncharacterized protein BT62DRAFT_935851 [Guyanagaster necrorhizus MCA 3950]KAG7442555.1 hypothetical protein BT62DRAFT_935851 [Guyanagaster necrorhizus MCA 3950]